MEGTEVVSKGSRTRVTKHEKYERRKQRIYMHTDGLLNTLGDRIKESGGTDEIIDGYKQALALRSIGFFDKQQDEKEARSLLMALHDKLDEKEGI